jgi:hypothetical protein
MPSQIGKTLDYGFGRRDRPKSDDFNARWADIDRRISQVEAFMPSWDVLVNSVTSDAVARIDAVITPLALKLQNVASLGFLVAYSTDTKTLHAFDVTTFTISAGDARTLFIPTPFLALERISTSLDFAVCQTISYDKVSGALVVRLLALYGNPGPFNDWSFTGTAGVSEAIRSLVATAVASAQTVTTSQATLITQQAALLTATSAASSSAATIGVAVTQAQAARDAAIAASGSVNATNLVHVDGTTPFNAVQHGVAPVASANDNSLITAAWAQSLVAALVNGAPGVLDTIKELADAIGDDANFATTVGNRFAAGEGRISTIEGRTTSLEGGRLRIDAIMSAFTAAQRQYLIKNLSQLNTLNVLADASTINFDVGTFLENYVIIGAAGTNRTITIPSNGVQGTTYLLLIGQDAVGGRTVSWSSGFDWGTAGPPILSTTANKLDIISLTCRDAASGRWYATLAGKGFSA